MQFEANIVASNFFFFALVADLTIMYKIHSHIVLELGYLLKQDAVLPLSYLVIGFISEYLSLKLTLKYI